MINDLEKRIIRDNIRFLRDNSEYICEQALDLILSHEYNKDREPEDIKNVSRAYYNVLVDAIDPDNEFSMDDMVQTIRRFSEHNIDKEEGLDMILPIQNNMNVINRIILSKVTAFYSRNIVDKGIEFITDAAKKDPDAMENVREGLFNNILGNESVIDRFKDAFNIASEAYIQPILIHAKTSNHQVKKFVEEITDGVYNIDPYGTFTSVNQHLAEIFGYEKTEDMLGLNFSQYTDESTTERLKKEFGKVWESGGTYQPRLIEYKIIRPNGEVRYIQISTWLQKDLEDHRKGFQGIVRDITDSKTAERSLRNSEKKYRLVTQNLSGIIFTTDMEGNVTFLSDSIRYNLGYDPENLKGKPLQFLIDEIISDDSKKRVQKLMHKQPVKKDLSNIVEELEVKTADGSSRWYEFRIKPFYDCGDTPIGMIGVANDITESREMANLADVILCKIGLDGKFTYVNRKGLETFGYTQEQVDEGIKVLSLIHPDDQKSVLEGIDEVLKMQANDDPVPRSYRMMKADGTIGSFGVSSRP
ncbi:MAG: PAS domain S-box protein, partial [Nanoarchaeota archaeon]|nr:PAS domain S-box protein [Nanoarchaeota archaeon]